MKRWIVGLVGAVTLGTFIALSGWFSPDTASAEAVFGCEHVSEAFELVEAKGGNTQGLQNAQSQICPL
jgi:hypothetical protein